MIWATTAPGGNSNAADLHAHIPGSATRFSFLLAALLFIASPSCVHAQTPTSSAAQAAAPDRTKRWQNSGAAKASAPQGRKSKARKSLSGTASYYAHRFHGRKTASGHPYHSDAMTAAHRSLPLGTWVRVRNDRNGNSVMVQITDRGPFVGDRVIDLSHAAAADLDMLHQGLAPVRIEVVEEYPRPWNGSPWNDARLAYGY